MNKMIKSILVMGCIAMLTPSCISKKKFQAAQAEAQSTIDQLKQQNESLNNQLNSTKQQLTELNTRDNALANEYAAYKAKCSETQDKLNQARAYLTEQYATLNEVEKKIEDALANFKDQGVDVYYKDGLVYVRMQDNLLYKSGSSKLDAKGINALGSLATVLNQYPKLKIVVVGNTDSVQFRRAGDNWSLSTERANGVVRILNDKYNVNPERITAAGRSKFNPVATNETTDGRAQNRRTDIILNPDLDRLWEDAAKQMQNP